MNEHILLAYGFDGKGGGEPLIGDAISAHIKNDALAWVHLDANNVNTRAWLEEEVSYLDPFVIEALLEEETRPRMNLVDNGILLILRCVNLNENADPEDMVSIRLWVDEHHIISLRRRSIKAADDIEAKIKQGCGPKNSCEFICMLTSKLFDRMEPVLSQLDEKTDEIEEHILEKADTALRQSIVDVRKKAILFRRHMAPQRDAIHALIVADIQWFDETYTRYLREVYNQVTRYVEDLGAIRERAQIINDELVNTIADKLNHNMYVLSVIAAIFLPLGFLTGLFGVNVAGIPWAESANAFLIFCTFLTLIVLVQIGIFRRLQWF